MTPWLLVDYGDVISLPFDDRAQDALAGLLAVDAARARSAYWQHRRAYDAGEPSERYWSRVADRLVSTGEARELDAVDMAGWGRVDPEMVALLGELRRAGTRLALLSNAPSGQADAYDRADWAPLFEHRLTSSRLGVAKPDRAIFTLALEMLDAAPADVTFVDDRPENVAAAAAEGIRAIRFTGVDDLRRRL